MGTNLLKAFFFRLAIEDILLLLQTTLLVNAKDACMTNAYHFNRERDTVKNHALRGHVIANVTARKPLFCFDACRLECRCISFNFKQSADQHNCQLNEENRYTNFDALEFAEDWQYYDLVIDYNNIRSDPPVADCQNSCCERNPCLNGGTCRESCDVIGRRFTCKCGPHSYGKLCEETCTPHDWVYFNNSCFKMSKEKLNWFDAHLSCTSNKSALTSIHSAEENDFLRKTGQALTPSSISSAWIGLFNLNSTDRSYQWVDGSMVDFRNWNDKEPNNAHSGENCTELYVTRNLGKWNDESCYSKRAYVCGKKLSP